MAEVEAEANVSMPADAAMRVDTKLRRSHSRGKSAKLKANVPEDQRPQHIAISSPENGRTTFHCTICEKSFGSRRQIRYHRFCDRPTDKPQKCSKCERTFVTPSHLRYHMQTHTSDQTVFKCSHCDRSFLRAGSLQKHKRISHPVDVFKHQCEICSKKFLFAGDLRTHEHKHKDELPHKCKHCEKGFLLKTNLTKHLIVHGEREQKFTCDDCGKKFIRKSSLNAHLLKHKSRKSFGPCDDCGKTFGNQTSLDRHLKTHMASKEYKCSLCEVQTTRKDNFRRHLKSLHPEIDLTTMMRNIKSPGKVAKKELPKIQQEVQPTAHRVGVIQSVGNAKPFETIVAKEIEAKCSKSPSVPSRVAKPKRPFDPMEIYRKILIPSSDEYDLPPASGEDEVSESVKETSREIFVHWRKRRPMT